ncbi:phosphomevalonate kinase [Lapidilactobacillus mulanensis]|uniref:phosphomevalonate kinase n=1 Tax=Lapidilactobacillus mulanensis TaxID=2485999 RepID=A0ABW4DNJ8_9LACO|nr:phosphomevalonate kinase [Lapidilactobacillus mulanensis]
MITVKAPGKLYIAGEYAVLEPGHPAILVALDRFITVTVSEAEVQGTINSQQYAETDFHWRRQGDQMVFDNRDNPFHYILEGIRVVETLALELGKPLRIYDLNINSQLEDNGGRKFGLGSSAAVTVATVKALSEFYQLNLSRLDIFKLAAIAHFNIQGNGSLGDIAASVFGGWLAFSTFDKDWLRTVLKNDTLGEVLASDWPGLKIEILHVPDELELLIGWTGSPASTSRLVDKITIAKFAKKNQYQEFLLQSQKCVQSIIAGIRAQNLAVVKSGIRENRVILRQLGAFSGVNIETPALKELCQIAENCGGAAKFSGAGGGDCGIVITDRYVDQARLISEWGQHQITTLPLSVYDLSEAIV